MHLQFQGSNLVQLLAFTRRDFACSRFVIPGKRRVFALYLFWCTQPFLLLGCTSIPYGVKHQVSDQGAQATRLNQAGPFILLQTLTYIPGEKFQTIDKYEIKCSSSNVSMAIVVFLQSVDRPHAAKFCEAGLDAAKYIIKYGRRDIMFDYSIKFIPPGAGIDSRRARLSINRLSPEYWLLGEQDERSTSDAIDTIAHETLHIVSGLNKLPSEVREREEEAYLAGACARLIVTGQLSKKSLVAYEFEKSPNVPTAALDSSKAAANMGSQLDGLFEGDEITRGSEAGMRVREYCDLKLGALFSN